MQYGIIIPLSIFNFSSKFEKKGGYLSQCLKESTFLSIRPIFHSLMITNLPIVQNHCQRMQNKSVEKDFVMTFIMLRFTGGLFLFVLLTFIVLLIEKISKNSSPNSQLEATILISLFLIFILLYLIFQIKQRL